VLMRDAEKSVLFEAHDRERYGLVHRSYLTK
jgi:hypothetical protein